MTNEEIIKDTFRKEAKPTAEDSAKKIHLRETTRKPVKRSFRDEPFFGMWKEREDMKEGGSEWVRSLRDGLHWNRSTPRTPA